MMTLVILMAGLGAEALWEQLHKLVSKVSPIN
jgi:hypothetical protein